MTMFHTTAPRLMGGCVTRTQAMHYAWAVQFANIMIEDD